VLVGGQVDAFKLEAHALHFQSKALLRRGGFVLQLDLAACAPAPAATTAGLPLSAALVPPADGEADTREIRGRLLRPCG
jgi:hypothetical protein